MASKNIIIIILLILVVGAGALWYSTREEAVIDEEDNGQEEQDEPITTDGSSDLLNEIKQETGVVFGELEQADFLWITETEEKAVSGKKMEALNISEQDYNKVEDYFESNGYKKDSMNVADATMTSKAGYSKDKVACIVTASILLDEQGNPLEETQIDVVIQCSVEGEIADNATTTNESEPAE